MLISALCTPQQGEPFAASGPTNQYFQEHARELVPQCSEDEIGARPRTSMSTVVGRNRSQPLEQRQDFGYERGLQDNLLEKDGSIFGRQHNLDHQPPSPEAACCVARTPMGQKRTIAGSEDDEDQEYSTGKKARPSSDNSASPVVYEFACPFYKRNRTKYCQQRSCRTSGWPSVHRVKEHLYRHHMHYVCDRCSSTFKVQGLLREHLRQEVACDVSPRSVPEDSGFDMEIEKKLRSRKKIDGQTEADKWTYMFRLLFPSFKDQQAPSPYVNYSLRDEPAFLHIPREESAEMAAQSPARLESDHVNLTTNGDSRHRSRTSACSCRASRDS